MLKYRQKYGQFIVEGRKNVHELIHSSYEVDTILATSAFLERNTDLEYHELISDADYRKLSAFETPPGIMAIAKTKNFGLEDLDARAPLTIALDHISDPGNLGTIIRTADWYGINQIVLSEGCTDFYNPKTISATMGSFTRCKFLYTHLPDYLQGKNSYGCFLKGANVHNMAVNAPAVLIIGSESHGISDIVATHTQNHITIPGAGQAESLNASVAAAIAIDNFVRIMAL